MQSLLLCQAPVWPWVLRRLQVGKNFFWRTFCHEPLKECRFLLGSHLVQDCEEHLSLQRHKYSSLHSLETQWTERGQLWKPRYILWKPLCLLQTVRKAINQGMPQAWDLRRQAVSVSVSVSVVLIKHSRWAPNFTPLCPNVNTKGLSNRFYPAHARLKKSTC